MIQIHKSITLTPFHPTNGGMNAYKNFPSGQRRILSNDNRFTPIATGKERNTWEPLYGLFSGDYTDSDQNGVPGVFGETFNIEETPHQIITNGVVDMPTDKYMYVPDSATIWHPGQILVLVPKTRQGWQIGIVNPVVPATGDVIQYKYSNQQIGVLLEPLEWVGASAATMKAKKPTVRVLIGYSKIPKRISTSGPIKAAPLATPKVAAK